MSRTPLFAAVKKALALASRDNSAVEPRTSALTRRTLLRSSAAAAGAAALSPLLDWSAYARGQPKGPIAIVGGGVAGLTAAYRLQKHGAKPVLFEASNRWGGRMFTRYNFYKGMFCEMGGELVDSNHEDLKNILDELGAQFAEHTLVEIVSGEHASAPTIARFKHNRSLAGLVQAIGGSQPGNAAADDPYWPF